MKLSRRKGALLMAAAPLIFLSSGLFLANAVMFSPESLPFKIGEALCFILSPALLICGVVVFIRAPHETKTREIPLTPAPRKPKVYSARRLKATRIIGAVLAGTLPALPFITNGLGGWQMFLALFVMFPYVLMAWPCLIGSLYLALHKKPRGIDVTVTIICTLLLVALPFGMTVVVFLPLILFATPYGLLVLVVVTIVALIRYFLKHKPSQNMRQTIFPDKKLLSTRSQSLLNS